MDKIKDEQDLLERYYSAECSVIWECSGSINLDIRDLNRQVIEYAGMKSLKVPKLEETNSIGF